MFSCRLIDGIDGIHVKLDTWLWVEFHFSGVPDIGQKQLHILVPRSVIRHYDQDCIFVEIPGHGCVTTYLQLIKQQNKSINKWIKLTNECVVSDKMNEHMKRNEAARFSYNLALVADVTTGAGQDSDQRKAQINWCVGGRVSVELDLLRLLYSSQTTSTCNFEWFIVQKRQCVLKLNWSVFEHSPHLLPQRTGHAACSVS